MTRTNIGSDPGHNRPGDVLRDPHYELVSETDQNTYPSSARIVVRYKPTNTLWSCIKIYEGKDSCDYILPWYRCRERHTVFGRDGSEIGHIPFGTCSRSLHTKLAVVINANGPEFCRIGTIKGINGRLMKGHIAPDEWCAHIDIDASLTIAWDDGTETSGFPFRDVLVVKR